MQKAQIAILGALVLFLAVWDIRLSTRVRLLEADLASSPRAAAGAANRLPAAGSTSAGEAPLAPALPAARTSAARKPSPASSLHDSTDAPPEVPRASLGRAPLETVPLGGTLEGGSSRKPPVTGTPPGPEPESDTPAGRRPGFLGIQGEDGPGGGVKINGVIPYSVAGASGLQPGDVIVEVNGQRVDTLASLSTLIRGAGEGAPASLRIRRGGVEFYQGVQFGAIAPR